MTTTRGFTGRSRAKAEGKRIPPGQYVTEDFPVLSAGPTPRIRTCFGSVPPMTNPVINTRSFGEDPQDVARYVEAFVRGIEEARHADVDVQPRPPPGERRRQGRRRERRRAARQPV